MLLELLLLVAHTKEGKSLFIKILQYSKELDPELADEYWSIYDDIENIVKNGHYSINSPPLD
jgi:hypothetical protein